ncbi:hypothetical protein [Moritella sp. 28]|uniref:hypothetical protein n=1 Tax=Moritella sp. 28 TaxID=2746232 RepID=UPI001BA86D2A|nr:hypothetical protein [Moritella sp. 28]QUM86838.1 hypothetical protein HWV02_21280 [Moritella sp. 28]
MKNKIARAALLPISMLCFSNAFAESSMGNSDTQRLLGPNFAQEKKSFDPNTMYITSLKINQNINKVTYPIYANGKMQAPVVVELEIKNKSDKSLVCISDIANNKSLIRFYDMTIGPINGRGSFVSLDGDVGDDYSENWKASREKNDFSNVMSSYSDYSLLIDDTTLEHPTTNGNCTNSGLNTFIYYVTSNEGSHLKQLCATVGEVGDSCPYDSGIIEFASVRAMTAPIYNKSDFIESNQFMWTKDMDEESMGSFFLKRLTPISPDLIVHSINTDTDMKRFDTYKGMYEVGTHNQSWHTTTFRTGGKSGNLIALPIKKDGQIVTPPITYGVDQHRQHKSFPSITIPGGNAINFIRGEGTEYINAWGTRYGWVPAIGRQTTYVQKGISQTAVAKTIYYYDQFGNNIELMSGTLDNHDNLQIITIN